MVGANSSHAAYLWGNAQFGNYVDTDSYCVASLSYYTAWSFVRTDPYSDVTKQCIGQHSSGSIQRYTWVNRVTGPCPADYADDGTGQCVAIPSCTTDAPSKYFTTDYGTFPTSPIDFEGCSYAVLLGANAMSCVTAASGVGLVSCTYTYNPSGYATSTESPFNGDETLIPPQEQPIEDTLTSTNSENTNFGTPIDNGDGTITTVDTESKTNTHEVGDSVWSDNDYIYVKSTTGTVTQYDKTITTLTNADGSKTEVVSIGSSITTPTIENVVIDKNTATGSSTTTNSTVIDNSSVTTNTYNSSGTLTGTTIVADGTGTGTGTDDETQQGNCGAPNQPACDVTLTGEEHLSDPSGLLTDSGVLSQRDANISDLQSGAGEDTGTLFSITNGFESSLSSVLGSGTCDPAYATVEYMGQPFAPFAKFCPVWDSDARPLLKWFFYMLTLISLYFIYLRAMRSN